MSWWALNQTLGLFLLNIGFFKYSFHFISSRPLETMLDNYDERAIQSFHSLTEWNLPWQVKYAIIESVQFSFTFNYNTLSCQKRYIKLQPWIKMNHHTYIRAARNLPFFKLHFSFPFGFSLQGWISEDIFVNDLFVKINIHRVSKMLTWIMT